MKYTLTIVYDDETNQVIAHDDLSGVTVTDEFTDYYSHGYKQVNFLYCCRTLIRRIICEFYARCFKEVK